MHLLMSILLAIMPLTEHKFYVSLCDMQYNAESARVEVSSKFFIDDFEKAIGLEAGEHITMPMDSQLLPAMSDYLQEHLVVSLDEQNCDFDLLGYEIEDDVVWVYLESEEMEDFTSVKIRGSQLTDVYPEQQNIIHFTHKGELQSLFLRKEKPSGVLNFD